MNIPVNVNNNINAINAIRQTYSDVDNMTADHKFRIARDALRKMNRLLTADAGGHSHIFTFNEFAVMAHIMQGEQLLTGRGHTNNAQGYTTAARGYGFLLDKNSNNFNVTSTLTQSSSYYKCYKPKVQVLGESLGHFGSLP